VIEILAGLFIVVWCAFDETAKPREDRDGRRIEALRAVGMVVVVFGVGALGDGQSKWVHAAAWIAGAVGYLVVLLGSQLVASWRAGVRLGADHALRVIGGTRPKIRPGG
jgi:hypothetical protein